MFNEQSEGIFEDYEVSVFESVGWLIGEDKDRVVIAREKIRNNEWRGILAIPRENILKIKGLR